MRDGNELVATQHLFLPSALRAAPVTSLGELDLYILSVSVNNNLLFTESLPLPHLPFKNKIKISAIIDIYVFVSGPAVSRYFYSALTHKHKHTVNILSHARSKG